MLPCQSSSVDGTWCSSRRTSSAWSIMGLHAANKTAPGMLMNTYLREIGVGVGESKSGDGECRDQSIVVFLTPQWPVVRG